MAQKGKQANQNQDGLSKELEEQKKQLMQSESTLKSMKNRLDRMYYLIKLKGKQRETNIILNTLN